jgi:glucokinase
VVDSGPDVPPQAEVHLLTHAGSPLEEWVSRRALRRDYSARAGRPDEVDVREIAALARDGDPAAAATFEGAFLVLGEVLGPWLERFGADQLVIGGSIAGAWDLIDRPLRAGLSRHSECRYAIGLAAEPVRSPLVGAAHVAS